MRRSRRSIQAAVVLCAGAATLATVLLRQSASHAAQPAAPTRASATAAGRSAPVRKPRVVATYPHDSRAFTQGLLLRGTTLFESTGLRGRSSVRAVDLHSGAVQRMAHLPAHLFGEGLALVERRGMLSWLRRSLAEAFDAGVAAVDGELVQLTWTSGVARVYDIANFELLREHRYDGQGWGLCFDGQHLAMSDGSATLRFRDPATFAVVRSVVVRNGSAPVPRLNELECIGEYIYANVWGTWNIVRIDKRSGLVAAVIDASEILPASERARLSADAVLNGIAHDPSSDTFLLTGKLWPSILRVEIK